MTDTASAAPSEQDLFERVFPMPEGCMRCGDTYAPTEYSAWAVSAFIERFKGWQAARRAHPTPPAVVEPLTDGLLQQHNRDSQELRRLCAARDQARSERDALKAEIAGLEASCSTLGRLVDELRPDAERLEWVLRRVSGTWLRAYLGVVSDTSDMDTLRTLIDANRGALTAHGIGIKKEENNG